MNIEKNKVENKRTLYIGLILAILLSVIFIARIRNMYGIGIINDEFGYWGIAAYFSGKNWSELLSTTPYYSYGYSMLVTGLYYIFDNSITVYRIAVGMNVIMILFSFFIAYQCGKKLYPTSYPESMLLICFAVTVYSNNIVQAQIAWTETLLYLLYWSSFYVLLLILENPKTQYVTIFAGLNIYMYIVHQRTLGVLLVSCLMIVFLGLTKKITVKQVITYFGIIIVLFWLGGNVKSQIIKELFTSKELVDMNNYSGQASKIVDIFRSVKGLKLLLQSILGKIFYFGLSTFLVGIVAIFVCAKQSLLGGTKFLRCRQKRIDDRTEIALYLFLSYMATFMIAAISMYQPYGRLDILLYGRYMEFTVGPLLLIGILEIVQKKMNIHFYIVCLIGLMLIAVMVNNTYLSLGTDAYNGICISALVYFFDNMTNVNGLAQKMVVVIGIVILILIVLMKSKKMKSYVTIITTVLLAFLWIGLGNYDGLENLQKSVKNKVLKIAEQINELENHYEIYVLKDEEGINSIAKYLQYYLPDYEIHIVDSVKDEKENEIYITDNDLNPIIGKNSIVLEKEKGITVFTSNCNKDILEEWSTK